MVKKDPQRIVTLLPSATEIVCALGLIDRLVGVTHECDYPAIVSQLPKVTSSKIPKGLTSREIDECVRDQLQEEDALYSLNIPLLKDLNPDLLITQALCDVCAVADKEVQSAAYQLPGKPEVINLEPMSLQEVFDTIIFIGKQTGIEKKALNYVRKLEARVNTVTRRTQQIKIKNKPRVAFFEWIDPLFNAGHWTPELIEMAGGIDCLGSKHRPSQTITVERLRTSEPDLIFIALCGFDIKRSAEDIYNSAFFESIKTLACHKNNQIYLVDGNSYFSRSGPRLVDSLEIMAHTFFPDLHPLPEQLPVATQVCFN